MNFFLRNSVERSVKDFDKELASYFTTTRNVRSRMRTGTIVLVDTDQELYKFLDFLVAKCGLPVSVVHVEMVCCARNAIRDIGADNVKAVIIDVNMLGDDLNGTSLPAWLSREHPRIPVWVSHCPPEKEKTIRKTMFRVGIFGEHARREDYVHALGLPAVCERAAAAYAT